MADGEAKDQKSSDTKRYPPGYFSETINYLLTSYSASPPEMKVSITRDLIGHITVSLIFMGKMDKTMDVYYAEQTDNIFNVVVESKPYKHVLSECTNTCNNAIEAYYQQKAYSEAIIHIGTVMDLLKQIIAMESLIQSKPLLASRPLETRSLEEDTILKYKDYEDPTNAS